MPISKRNLPVACTIEEAFEYVAEWSNLRNFMPMFVDIRPVSMVAYGPGTSLETVMVISKTEIVSTLDLVEFVKNKRILFKATRGIRSKLSWDFLQLPDKVLVTYAFEYEIPDGLVRRETEKAAIEKELDDYASQSMELLKWMLESQSSLRKT
jgi:hypothetical protein